MLFCIATGPTLLEAKDTVNQALNKVQGIEFRFDLFQAVDLKGIKELVDALGQNRSLKLLFTLRPVRQGGEYKGSEESRLSLLKQLCALGPDYVDLECDVPLPHWKEFAAQFPKIHFICSFHDFVHAPKDLDHLLSNMKNPYASIYKIAAMAHASHDALRMMEFVRRNKEICPLIGIAMGEAGVISRILGPVAGNYFDYASVLQSTAPGQLSVEQMEKPYRHSQLNTQTALYGLIGYPTEKSLGHKIHNAVFEANRANAVYVKMPVRPEDLPSFIESAKTLPFKGLSITMPLKEEILRLLDSLSSSAQAIGAVNTIVVENGKWIGHNTDGIGALNAVEVKIPVKDKQVLIIGAGGAAKAIIYEAVQRGAHVTVLNRTASKAKELATLYHCEGGGFELFPKVIKKGYDILINTIPEGELIDEEWILPNTVAMDIVYIPKNTPFLLKASRKNCRLVFGYEMFIGQAIEQQLIWFPENKGSVLRQIIEPIVLAEF
ncbi:MAG: shikimate dehydrogenase [Verrucomicrobia bacterium]|nr:shikimate dehydrogenase [Verrucomicrobiota bacterium]